MIGASLSEPHTDAVAGDLVGIYINIYIYNKLYICAVRHAANSHLPCMMAALLPGVDCSPRLRLGCGIHQPAMFCAQLAPVTTIGFVSHSQKSKFIGAATTFSFQREEVYTNEALAAYRPYPSSMLSSILSKPGTFPSSAPMLTIHSSFSLHCCALHMNSLC